MNACRTAVLFVEPLPTAVAPPSMLALETVTLKTSGLMVGSTGSACAAFHANTGEAVQAAVQIILFNRGRRRAGCLSTEHKMHILNFLISPPGSTSPYKRIARTSSVHAPNIGNNTMR